VGHDVTFTLLPEAPRRYIFAWRDIGQGNLVGIQVGQRLQGTTLGARYGLIDSQVGAGLDYRPGPTSLLSVEVYNLNRLTANVFAHYFLQPDQGISLRVHGIFVTPTVAVGYFWRF
jgi:hypothetical protein